MREITTHKGNELDDQLKIVVLDEPGHSGASHKYQITDGAYETTEVFFQNGPVKEHGVNGISIESLLAICIDRLEGFQGGPYKNVHNGVALSHLEAALDELKIRTRNRQARGVEGTSTP